MHFEDWRRLLPVSHSCAIPHSRTLDRETLEDILVGCSYLGGGGSLSEGTALLADDMKSGLRFELLWR